MLDGVARFVRAGQSAVLAHAPDVDGDHQARHRRQHDHVQHVKADQRLLPNHVAAEDQEFQLLADEGA